MYPVLHPSRQNNVVGEQLPSPQRAFILAHETSVPGCATVFTDSICSVARYVPATFSKTQTTFRCVIIPGTPRVIETYNYEFLKEDLMVNK